MKCFANDNYFGIHPDILNAIISANADHEISYCDDFTHKKFINFLENIFGDLTLLFTFNRTWVNVISLKNCTLPFHVVVCAETAHINTYECGVPAPALGCTLLTLPNTNSKLTSVLNKPLIKRKGKCK